MAKSERTKSLIFRKRLFGFISVALWVGTAIFTFVAVLIALNSKDPSGKAIFSEEFKQLLASLGVTAIIGITLAAVIKDKIRTAVWMICLIALTVIYKEVGMYATLGVWFIDEYVFHMLYIKNKELVTINKEIDLRGI